MYRAQLPEATITDYGMIEEFYASMHRQSRQHVENQYTADKYIYSVIATAERPDSIHRSTGAYSQECYGKQPKESTHKKLQHKPKKKLNNDGNLAKKMEERKAQCNPLLGGGGN